MKLFPSERDRQKSDTRTVSWFYLFMFIVTVAYGVIGAVLYLLRWR